MSVKLQVLLAFVLVIGVHGTPLNNSSKQAYKLYSRQDWGAAAATDTRSLTLPVPVVVIHHTYIPGECHEEAECMKSMRSMQKYHLSQNWGDIGYNFCVGGEGGVYEGRGWTVVGIHAGKANNYSIGICLIGDFREQLPTKQQLAATKALIADGIDRDFISPIYKVIGHNQVSATECPGGALKREISTWPHYDPKDYKSKNKYNLF